DRMGGILLQKSENLAVDGVHRGKPCERNKCNLDGGGRMISSLPGVFEVYLEDYSPATEIRRQRAALPACGARRPFVSKASTSARRGAAMLPPRRVHLSPAAAAANRSAATTSRPSASASVNAPWNTSPAPRVSIASTANTGLWRKATPSRQSTSRGPWVTARKDGVLAAIAASAAPRSSRPLVARRHSLENTTWVAIRNSSSDICVGRSASSTTVRPRARAATQIGRTNSGKRLSATTASAHATRLAGSAGVAA